MTSIGKLETMILSEGWGVEVAVALVAAVLAIRARADGLVVELPSIC